MATSFERLAKEEGRVEGKIEGKIEGNLLGRTESQQLFFLDLLTARFEVLPTWVSKKVKTASKDMLLGWALAMLDHDTLEDIFGS